jgi:hypothetical protein
MMLLLGSHVREHGHRVGRLAGFELEPATFLIRRIIFSPDGDLGPQAMTRAVAAINSVHDDGEIELQHDALPPLPAVSDVVLLSHATRVRRADHDVGRVVGVEVNAADRALISVFGRRHRWSRRFALGRDEIDVSTPGEVRTRSRHDTRAA